MNLTAEFRQCNVLYYGYWECVKQKNCACNMAWCNKRLIFSEDEKATLKLKLSVKATSNLCLWADLSCKAQTKYILITRPACTHWLTFEFISKYNKFECNGSSCQKFQWLKSWLKISGKNVKHCTAGIGEEIQLISEVPLERSHQELLP